MTIAIGCDHAGDDLKKDILSLLHDLRIECIDYGTNSAESVDYPDFGEKVSEAVSSGKIAHVT
jgi:ribose 5-phosphate isomerase B